MDGELKLKAFDEDDLIIISDLDEIPNPKKILNFKPNFKYKNSLPLFYNFMFSYHSAS